MRTTLLIAALLLTTTIVAVVPSAEARQVCTYGTGDPCDEYAACVWNRIDGQWECVVYVDPCWFRCW